MFVDGTKNVTVSVKDGKFSADLCDLGASVYNITVVYDGDGNHLSSNDSTNLTVHCLNGSFDVGVGDIVYGDGFIIDVANATGVNGILLNGTVDVIDANSDWDKPALALAFTTALATLSSTGIGSILTVIPSS